MSAQRLQAANGAEAKMKTSAVSATVANPCHRILPRLCFDTFLAFSKCLTKRIDDEIVTIVGMSISSKTAKGLRILHLFDKCY